MRYFTCIHSTTHAFNPGPHNRLCKQTSKFEILIIALENFQKDPEIFEFSEFYFETNQIFRSTDDGDHHENGMEEPAEDFSTFKKAVNESICHQKDQSNVDRNEMTSKYPRIISRDIFIFCRHV